MDRDRTGRGRGSDVGGRVGEDTYAEEGDAADDRSVLGRGEGIVSGADEALGLAAATGALDVLGGRHGDGVS